MKTKITKVITGITLLIFLISIPMVASAKPGKGNGQGPKSTPAVTVEKDKDKHDDQKDNKDNGSKTTIKDNKGKQNDKKPPFIPKNKSDKQLAEVEKKLTDIEKGVNDIKLKIDKYTLPVSTPSAITTPSAVITPVALTTTNTSGASVTGYVYGNPDGKRITDVKGFVMGTSGKLKALTNRLSAIDKELKSLGNKISTDAAEKYKALAAKSTSLKGTIAELLKRLQAMVPNKTTVSPK